eukprot:1984449-Prymnesium_polylepis.1
MRAALHEEQAARARLEQQVAVLLASLHDERQAAHAAHAGQGTRDAHGTHAKHGAPVPHAAPADAVAVCAPCEPLGEPLAEMGVMDLAVEMAVEMAVDEARRREADAAREAKLCVVCLEAPKSHAFPACMHKCVCAGCAFEIEASAPGGQIECPLCRVPSTSVKPVFE